MLKGLLRVPTHRVDLPGSFIFLADKAWDTARINDELAELVDLARAQAKRAAVEAAASRAGVAPDDLAADLRAKAEAVELTDDDCKAAIRRHPVMRYRDGETRFQIDAPDVGPRGPACAADYLRPDVPPTVFTLRRVPLRERALIEVDTDAYSRWTRWVKAGVSRIATGGEVAWEAKDAADRMPDDWLEVIGDADGGAWNLIMLAGACASYSGPLKDAEGKR